MRTEETTFLDSRRLCILPHLVRNKQKLRASSWVVFVATCLVCGVYGTLGQSKAILKICSTGQDVLQIYGDLVRRCITICKRKLSESTRRLLLLAGTAVSSHAHAQMPLQAF